MRFCTLILSFATAFLHLSNGHIITSHFGTKSSSGNLHTDVAGIIDNENKVYAGPDFGETFPCKIQYDDLLSLYCYNISNEQLTEVFKSDLPSKNLFSFDLTSNNVTAIGDIAEGFTFVLVSIRAPLTSLHPNFLAGSTNTLISLELDSNYFDNNNGFWATVSTFNNLTDFRIDGTLSANLTIPKIESDTICDFSFINCGFQNIPQDYFTSLPNVENIYLYGNNLMYDDSLPPRVFPLGNKKDVFINLDSNNIHLLNPDIFQYPEESGESHTLELDMSGNPMGLLEASIKEIIDQNHCNSCIDYYALVGKTPIDCGCLIKWIFSQCEDGSSYQRKIRGTCSDGRDIQYLNPNDYANCTHTGN